MNRSLLYSIKPIGIGTHRVESLTSYIGRIAAAHSVTSGHLLNNVINILLQKEYIDKVARKGGDGFYKSTNAINGNGSLASEFVEVMEELTGRTDLNKTTLSIFSKVLPNRHLMKSFKAWCPYCFNNMRGKSDVYEPLIWSIGLITECEEHKLTLIDRCPNCLTQQSNLARSYVPGYCNKCSYWLGTIDSGMGYKPIKSSHRIIVNLLESCQISNNRSYNYENIFKSIEFIVTSVFNNNVALAARSFGFSKTTFYGWYTEKNVPTINNIVIMCLKLEINIVDFLDGILTEQTVIIDKGISSEDDVSYTIKKRKRHNPKEIKLKLNNVINGNQIETLKKIAFELNCDRRLLSRKYPLECSKIKRNNLRIINSRKKQRKINIEILLNVALKEAKELNKYPSVKFIENSIGVGVLREVDIKNTYNKLKSKN